MCTTYTGYAYHHQCFYWHPWYYIVHTWLTANLPGCPWGSINRLGLDGKARISRISPPSKLGGHVDMEARNVTMAILGSTVSHSRVIVGLSQSAPAVGWGSPTHAWLASVNWIGCARYLNRGYSYGARGRHYLILLRQYSQNYYTYNSVVKNINSPCHKDTCVQISTGSTE